MAEKIDSIADFQARVDKAVRMLLKRKVLVGIPSDATQSGVEASKAPPLWVIGYQNEFGDDELHIPPRPFLVPGVESRRDKITDGLQKAAAYALSGDLAKADGFLDIVGEIAKEGVVSTLRAGQFTPLSPKTIYNRQHRKGPPKTPPPNNRTSPLIDQSDLLRSIQSVVDRGR